MMPLTDSFVVLMSTLIYVIDIFLLVAFGFAAYYLWVERRKLPDPRLADCIISTGQKPSFQ